MTGNNDGTVAFDSKTALEQVGGDRDLLKELVDIYAEEYPSQLQKLGEAVENKEADTVRETAHTIKGAVGNFGAHSTVKAALNLENIGKSGDLSVAGDALAALRTELEQLERELNNVV